MNKRVVIALVAVLSLGAMWWTYAWAATCLQYRTVGGSSMCTAWSTKGVQVEVTFKDECFVAGEGGGLFSTCTATATATADDSVAFCVDPTYPGGFRPVSCPGVRQFNEVLTTPCEGKHDQDSTGEGGVGHGHHGCTQRIVLAAECTDCCVGVGTGVCADVTPVEMDTRVAAFVGFSEIPVVAFEEHCSINPKKIPFINPLTDPLAQGRQYQCNLVCVDDECVPED